MVEDAEKRFDSIMNKLFHSPLPSVPKALGQKRKYAASELNVRGGTVGGNSEATQPPLCRPWDRADLMRRLATFKSMTWFAKPKSVDAVSCARRGWVNVDMDIIACESCGARLQFTTPSTWQQQQVEKAALVFSLKLDTGHKLLCPWIDNACDESLALFPPTAAPKLVDEYKERSSALLQLSALPVISNSAIEGMRTPQLVHFIEQPRAVECGTKSTDPSGKDCLGTDMETLSGELYYKAHRLLSLCGWEPRLLPYIVECGDKHKLSGSASNLTGLSGGASSEENSKFCVYVSGSDEIMKDNENSRALSTYHDPSSIVLDCKLCGASVGLWAFATVPRPLEMVRFIGSSEIGGGNERSDLSVTNNSTALSRVPALNMTIAGGPLPAKQNFRTIISLPVIGRSVRARFSSLPSEVRNTDEQVPESPGIMTVDSIENSQSKEIRDPRDDVDASDANGVKSGTPSAVGDDIANDELLHIENTTSTKEPSLVPTTDKKDDGVEDVIKTTSQEKFTSAAIDKDLRRHCADGVMEFHPVRQHRHFCPWVASTDATAPGWQQTLSALQKEKVFLLPDHEGSPSSPSIIRIDDPITSIRKLFESPPAKRAKPTLTKTPK